jgi:hypothetical protein
MMARLDQRFRLALHQTFRESPDNFFSAGIRRVAAGCCSGALWAEFVVKAQSLLRLAANVAPAWRDDKRISRKALLQVPYPCCAPLSASAKGNKSANFGHSLRHEERRVVACNPNSASAQLMASAIGVVPLA